MQRFSGSQNPNMQRPSARPNQGMMHSSERMSRGDRQGPPEEAFTACNGKSQGKPCTVVTPQGTLSGICISRNDQLFCVPEGHGPGRGRGRGTGMAPTQ